MTRKKFFGKFDVLPGGRAAEYISCGEISTGAANEIDRATGVVQSMLTEYGV